MFFDYNPLKWPLPANERTSELVLDTFVMPLADFVQANESLDLSAIQSISFVFDVTEEGILIVDDLGVNSP